MAEGRGVLITVGEEEGPKEGSKEPLLKCWDLTRDERKGGGGAPVLMRSVKVNRRGRIHPVSHPIYPFLPSIAP